MRSDYSFKTQIVYSTEVSLFLIIISESVEAFVPFKDSVPLNYGLCIRNHSRTATSTSSLLWHVEIILKN